MNAPIKSSRPHALIIAAAVSVILLSGLGVARMLDILPDSQANAASISAETEARELAEAEAKAEAALALKALEEKAAAQKQAQRQSAQPQAAVCKDCGVITAITEQPGAAGTPASGLGAVTGAVIGGVLGNQVGKGDGRRAARIAGALGGAYAGHVVEGKVRTSSTYLVSVRFDDGRVEQFTYADQPSAFVGMLVRSESGQLVPRN
ncbi:MAG: glycine zipper 2TM domain-containing protein [Moraxellaceae bacterium]|nr:glycine zipper 2TM domain-containing protein [Moraxellaceae bacterium]MDZ4386652.1 glycine zipper 2TM domain-containing protein [Moraxellaceae bacterium]